MDSGPDSTWPRCPEAAQFFNSLSLAFTSNNQAIAEMADRFLSLSGVTLSNLVDHWSLPGTSALEAEMTAIGLHRTETEDGDIVWEHPSARLPRVRTEDAGETRMAVAVEDITLFAECNGLPLLGRHGDPDSGYEEARFPQAKGELAILARRGYRGFRPGQCTAADERALKRVRGALRARSREGDGVACAEQTATLLRSLSEEVERDRLTDEFFAAERDHYMRSNRAARWQYERQQALGIGWANHDHHTYRSSRAGFRSLVSLWLELGFEAREKFYAGAAAGWGAQILEHPVSRVVLFCDVDMAPHEIGIDFAASTLPELSEMGTIGLWCGLHSESIAAAGLHHLEAEFEYALVRDKLEAAGFGVMPPFTNLPMLKQAFTRAEAWPVTLQRAAALCARGLITAEQRDQFASNGAPGSHLEILQRWDGFKGFNKTGIDAIIRETDARNRVVEGT